MVWSLDLDRPSSDQPAIPSLTDEEQGAWAKRIAAIPERRAVVARWRSLRGEAEPQFDNDEVQELSSVNFDPVEEAGLSNLLQILRRSASR